jgi:capsular exopolysaccharide synthesis family protein
MGSLIINKEFNIIILINVLRKHWYKPLIISAFGLITAFLYLRYTKQTFESTSTIQIVEEDRVKDVLGDKGVVQSNTDLSEEIELLRSDVLFQQMLRKLNMEISVFSEGKLLTKNLYGNLPFSLIMYEIKDSSICGVRINLLTVNNKNIILSYQHNGKSYKVSGIFNQVINSRHFKLVFRTANPSEVFKSIENNNLYFQINNQAILATEMKSGLKVEPLDPNAKTIQLSYVHNNPIICYNVVRNLLDVYLNFDKSNKQSKTNQTITFIDQQVDSLSRLVNNSKDSLSDFQRNERIPNPERVESQLSENINDLTGRLLEINEEISTLIMVNNKISLDPNRLEIYRLIPEMVGKKSFEGTILRQIEDLNKLLETQEDLLRDVTEENKQNKVINERITNRVVSIKRSLKMIDDRLKNDRLSIQSKINEIEAKYYGLPEKTMEFERLKYMQELNNRYLSLFTEKKIEYELSNAGYSTSNRILNAPNIPSSAISPNITLTYLLLGFLSFFIGLLIPIFRYLTYNEITSIQDLQSLLPSETNILGSLPIYRKKMKHSQIVVSESSKSRLAEAIRNIRSNMSFINKDAKVIAISSSVSGEGKTFVILNLAGLIAASGKKIVVIDLDLRKPKLHHGFNSENTNGMSNFISGLSTFDEVIQHSTINNLDFITSGLIPPNPSELIQSDAFKTILNDLKERYDMILIDNPPVGIVSDGIHILAQADIPIYVFKANYSKRVFAERVEELFKVQKLKNLNVILNGTENNNSIYGYVYQYSYNDSGYYTEDERSGFFLFNWMNELKMKWKK